MAEVLDRAVVDAEALAGGGADGVMIENFGDAPFLPGRVPPETVAAMATAVAGVRSSVQVPVGVNVLRNDVRSALGVAAATGAGFVRVNIHVGTMFTDQGRIDGVAGETLRARAALGAHIPIFADVLVKHATPPPGTRLGDAARDTWHRGLADALVISGAGTGLPTSGDDLSEAREAVPEARIWIGSGLTVDRVKDLLPGADGAIVGSAFQRDGRAGAEVEPDRVAHFMEEVERLRAQGSGWRSMTAR
jgi:membrane complex biogenesis BtpA family protein